jgi:hypothetical protein
MKLIRKRAIPPILKPSDRIQSSPDIETFVLKQTDKALGRPYLRNHRKTVPESRRSNVLTAEVFNVLADETPSARLPRQN